MGCTASTSKSQKKSMYNSKNSKKSENSNISSMEKIWIQQQQQQKYQQGNITKNELKSSQPTMDSLNSHNCSQFQKSGVSINNLNKKQGQKKQILSEVVEQTSNESQNQNSHKNNNVEQQICEQLQYDLDEDQLQNQIELEAQIKQELERIGSDIPKYTVTLKYLQARKQCRKIRKASENPAPIIFKNIEKSFLIQRREILVQQINEALGEQDQEQLQQQQ
ncbi:hypothetical protein PPERSA_00208 [Pseudocohnilembus persalinus]|uniref:Uncharacterized protein n=1 Tax=Pseudocohnilembus persalinus TaxID=266149 RepID=A0A0V0QQN4_PSEPJ|nr:hypothetical protein PPERSA_00208 [Pseudocohnilembus persalinus]|eukprot:KRX04439.1 hypothetical protein PPERSA_00208 [Pseudocohnilembus persalinus]